MPNFTRRQALAVGSGLVTSVIAPIRGARAAVGDTLNIAYNVNLPSFDPNVGPSSVNPTIQAIYRSIFDQFIGQKPDLSFEPGLLTSWGWNDDKSKVFMEVRSGVTWHDGTPFTPEDVVWSIARMGKPDLIARIAWGIWCIARPREILIRLWRRRRRSRLWKWMKWWKPGRWIRKRL